MRAFDYSAPTSVAEAVELLAGQSGTARALAGGTDLITQLKEGRRQADLVVDLKRIPALNRLDFSTEGGLTVGAAVPCVRLQESAAVRRHFPMLIHVCSLIGSYQIQSRASLGGNLCNASPSADGIPPLVILSATALIAGPNGQRELSVEEFCTGPGSSVLQPGEILVEIRIPTPLERSGATYLRFIPRNEMDIAVAGVGSALRLAVDGTVESARICLAAVAPIPLRVLAAEQSLVGQRPTPDALIQAGRIAAEAAQPISDVRASAEYRKHLVSVLTRRTLDAALQQAMGGN